MTAVDPTPTGPERAAIAALAKVELHCHLEGTMRPTTVAELAKQAAIAFPVEDPAELYHFSTLTEFLTSFWFAQSTLIDRDAWARVAYESIMDGAKHGLMYRETFITPARQLLAGVDLGEIIAGVDEGLALAERETGTVARVIFDIDREFGPTVALEQVQALCSYLAAKGPGAERIVGLGMDSTELGVDPASFVESFRLARSCGLRLTAHQGENSPASAAATAVDVLGIERLDHGFSVMEDRELVKRLADRQMAFTLCPNANVRINTDVFTDITQHPLDAMRRAGLLVTLNTDDPAFVGLDLTEEYALTAAAFGYDLDDLAGLVGNAIAAAWLDDSERAELRTRLEKSRHDVVAQ